MKLLLGIAKLGALLVVSSILGGCATPALWAKKLYQPAEHPNLAVGLTEDGGDVLICYDEHCGKSLDVKRRAYCLFAYAATGKQVKPKFTNPLVYEDLDPVCIMDIARTNAAPPKGYCTFTQPDSHHFQLFKDGNNIGSFDLPVYKAAPPARFWRIGLTPVAVATDAAIVGLCSMGYAAH
jgi:hypothetical protein